MQAIIFDFNGTMFLDTDKQRRSWNDFFEKCIGRPLTNEEFVRYACGPESAAWCCATSTAPTLTTRIAALTEEKEVIYRRLCREDKERFRLADGLPEALDRLQARACPWPSPPARGAAIWTFTSRPSISSAGLTGPWSTTMGASRQARPGRLPARLRAPGVAAKGRHGGGGRLCRHRRRPTPPARGPSSPSPPPIRPGAGKTARRQGDHRRLSRFCVRF